MIPLNISKRGGCCLHVFPHCLIALRCVFGLYCVLLDIVLTSTSRELLQQLNKTFSFSTSSEHMQRNVGHHAEQHTVQPENVSEGCTAQPTKPTFEYHLLPSLKQSSPPYCKCEIYSYATPSCYFEQVSFMLRGSL